MEFIGEFEDGMNTSALPTLCKGRDRVSGEGIVTNCLNCSICAYLRVSLLTIPQSLRDSSLYTREPFALAHVGTELL